MTNYNPLVATVTVAVGALAALGAIVYQVMHGHEADAQLTGLAGLLFGAFLRMPGQADTEHAKHAEHADAERVGADLVD